VLQDDLEDDTWADVNIELMQYDFSMQSVRCAAHTLQLAVEDAIRDGDLQATIAAARNLVRFLLNDAQVRKDLLSVRRH